MEHTGFKVFCVCIGVLNTLLNFKNTVQNDWIIHLLKELKPK